MQKKGFAGKLSLRVAKGHEEYDTVGMTQAKLLAKALKPHPCRLFPAYGCSFLLATLSALAASNAAANSVCQRWMTDLLASTSLAALFLVLLDAFSVLFRAVVMHYCHNQRWRRLLPAAPPEKKWTEEEVREAFEAFDNDGSGWLEVHYL